MRMLLLFLTALTFCVAERETSGQAHWTFFSNEVPSTLPDFFNEEWPLGDAIDGEPRVEPAFVAPDPDAGTWRIGFSFVLDNLSIRLTIKHYPVKLEGTPEDGYQLTARADPRYFRDMHTMFAPFESNLIESSRLKTDVMYYFDYTVKVDDFGEAIYADDLADRWLIIFQLWQTGSVPFQNPPIALHLHDSGEGLRWLLKQNTEQPDGTFPENADLGPFTPNTEYQIRMFYRASTNQNGHIGIQIWDGAEMIGSYQSPEGLNTTHAHEGALDGTGPLPYWGAYITDQTRTLLSDTTERTEGIQANFDNMTLLEVTGDLSADGEVAADDIDLLYDMVDASAYDVSYDMNGDFGISVEDVDALVMDTLGTAYGDANLDGFVNVFDFLILRENILLPGGWAEGDFDGDDTVDRPDVLLFRENFGFGL